MDGPHKILRTVRLQNKKLGLIIFQPIAYLSFIKFWWCNINMINFVFRIDF